jgi:hypothetical protein
MSDQRSTRSLLEEALANQPAQSDTRALLARGLEGVSSAPDEQIAREFLPGFGGGASRISLARADTPQEATMRLRQQFPEGQYFPPGLMTGDRATYQTAPGEPLSFVAPTIGEAFETGGFAGAAGEILQRTTNLFAPSAEAIAAETALLAATGGSSAAPRALLAVGGAGARLMRYVLAGAAGGAAGETARQGVQSATGVQGQTLGQQGQQVVGSGISGAAGGALGFGLESGVTRLTSAGPLGVSETGQQAVRAMDEMSRLPGAPRAPAWMGATTERVGLMPQQVAREGVAEIIKRVAGAASRVWPRINNYTQQQRETILNAIELARDPASFGTARAELTQVVDELNAAFASDLSRSLGIRGMNAEELGIAIAAGREVYETVSKEAVDGLYEIARSGGDYRFDTSPVDEAIQSIQETVLAPFPGRPSQFSPEFRQVMGDPLPGPSGGSVDIAPDGVGPVRSWIAEWGQIDTSQLGVDEIRRLRSNLYLMSQPGYEGPRLPDSIARRLRGALSEALDRPVAYVGPDGVAQTDIPEEPLQAWRAANEAARQRFTNLENSTLMEIARSDRPYQTARNIVLNPEGVDQVIALRRTLNQAGEEGARAWGEITNGFKADLVSSIGRGELPERLAAYDGRNRLALDALLDPSERQAFEATSSAIQRARQTDIPEIARNQETAQSFAQALLGGQIPSSRPAAIIDTLGELARRRGVNSWAETAPAQAIRAAAFDTIIDSAIETTARGPRLNQGRYERALRTARQRGLMELITPEDRVLLENVELVNRVVEQSAADVGTAIAGASTAQVGGLSDFLLTLPYLTVGRVLTSNAGRNILIGTGIQTPRSVARTVNFAGRLIDDATLSQEQSADLAAFMGQIDQEQRERERRGASLPASQQGMLERGLQQGRAPTPQR